MHPSPPFQKGETVRRECNPRRNGSGDNITSGILVIMSLSVPSHSVPSSFFPSVPNSFAAPHFVSSPSQTKVLGRRESERSILGKMKKLGFMQSMNMLCTPA